jgi:hypothetical protein
MAGRGFATRHAFHHSTVAARTGWFRRNPYCELPAFYRSEDAELWCRTSAHTRFEQLADPVMYIREVGVFSSAKYIGTQMGVITLAQQYSRTKRERLFLMSREIAKLWLMCALDVAGCADCVVCRRSIALDPASAARAARGLGRVASVSLPIDPNGAACAAVSDFARTEAGAA